MASREAVYEMFGRSAEAAQLFETELGTVLLALEGAGRGWVEVQDVEAASAFYEKLNRQTLGQTIGLIKARTDLGEELTVLVQQGLTARNRLSHGFFATHGLGLHSASGREAMLSELHILHGQLLGAWRAMQEVSAALVEPILRSRT